MTYRYDFVDGRFVINESWVIESWGNSFEGAWKRYGKGKNADTTVYWSPQAIVMAKLLWD